MESLDIRFPTINIGGNVPERNKELENKAKEMFNEKFSSLITEMNNSNGYINITFSNHGGKNTAQPQYVNFPIELLNKIRKIAGQE